MFDGYEDISREEAKQLIDDADKGLLLVINREPIPTIGDVPDEERAENIEIDGYSFGDEEETDA